MKFIRRMYDWVLSWAETPYGGWALFILAFAESSFFPIPPDVLLIALCVGDRRKAFKYAAICTLGSVLGALVGYGIGWGLWASVDQLFFNYVPGFTQEKFDKVEGIYKAYDFWFIFVAAFTPLPFKVFTVTGGAFGISLIPFLIASIIGRGARFFLVGGMLYLFGEPIQKIIDRWFNLLTVAFVLLLIGGFAILKFAGH
jgi:membrane protein YqaA with SNARE-associated domain